MLSEEQLRGSVNTADRQLLWDIREELRKLNKCFESQPHTTEERLRPTAEDTTANKKEGVNDELSNTNTHSGNRNNNKRKRTSRKSGA